MLVWTSIELFVNLAKMGISLVPKPPLLFSTDIFCYVISFFKIILNMFRKRSGFVISFFKFKFELLILQKVRHRKKMSSFTRRDDERVFYISKFFHQQEADMNVSLLTVVCNRNL